MKAILAINDSREEIEGSGTGNEKLFPRNSADQCK
jgi:hypothetical protein